MKHSASPLFFYRPRSGRSPENLHVVDQHLNLEYTDNMRNSQAQKLKSVVLSALFFAVGFSVFFSIANNVAIQRDPASLNEKMNTLSGLDRDQLKSEIEKKVRFTTINNGKEKTIVLQGFSSNLCQQFQNVELTFIAEGVSVAGEPAKMKINSPCEAAQDPAEMASIRIPIEKIMSEKPRDAEFSFIGYNSKFTFSKSADEWPHVWILSSFEFISVSGKSKLVKLLDENRTTPIVLEF